MNETIRSQRLRRIYSDFITNFIFWSPKDIKRKANKVFVKVFLSMLAVEMVLCVAVYVATVFVGDNALGVMESVRHYILHNEVFLILLVNVLLALASRQWFLSYQVENYHSPNLGDCERMKLLKLSKLFPKLDYVVRQRIVERGFLSRLDYKTLCINRIYDDLELDNASH